jgi:hypothetical protein
MSNAWILAPIVVIDIIFVFNFVLVDNEKRGGSGSKLLLEYSFGPWRSMYV